MKVIEEDCYNWDECWEMVFYYCIVCLYFGSGDNDKVIDYFNLIINQKNLDYWVDIQCFVCIFNFIVYYELGNVQLVEYQVKLVYWFLFKMEELYVVQKEIFCFICWVFWIMEEDLKEEFSNLCDWLLKYELDFYECCFFFYLDIIFWLEAKVFDCMVEAVVQEKVQVCYVIELEGQGLNWFFFVEIGMSQVNYYDIVDDYQEFDEKVGQCVKIINLNQKGEFGVYKVEDDGRKVKFGNNKVN